MLNFNEFQAINSPKNANLDKKDEQKEQKVELQSNTLSDKDILVANPSQMVVSKGKIAISIAATAAISAALVWSVSSGRINTLRDELEKLRKTYAGVSPNVLDDLKKSQKTVNDLTKAKQESLKAIKELQNQVKELQNKYGTITSTPEDAQKVIEAKAQGYRKIIENLTSIYDEAKPPEVSVKDKKTFKKTFLPSDVFPFSDAKKELSFSYGVLKRFRERGSVYVLRDQPQAKITQDILEKGMLSQKDMEDIGRKLQSDFTVAYGKRTGWSDEKIARDIFQNFYDGGDFSLNDVNFRVSKLNNGKYKISIEGDSIFKHTELKFMGSGNKLENPKSAGGFGEGSKVVIANLLDKGYTDEIRFRSADWEYVFDAQDGIIMRTLNKKSEIIHGNTLEFETNNEKFIESLIKGLDFFEHEKNPDFRNLTFENDDFGFRILKRGEKGNFYLTQRFEYGKSGAWDNNVEGLTLVFKKKPDIEKYKEITYEQFDTGRDRKFMDETDVYKLIKYFSKSMSDEEIIKAILSTQEHWYDFKLENKTAIKEMVSALCEEAASRKIGVDFSGLKICKIDYRNSDVIVDTVRSLGYEVIDARGVTLDSIGMPVAADIFKEMSHHKAIKPTPVEAKKLKILEEATRVIQQGFEETYIYKAKTLFKRLTLSDFKINKDEACLLDREFFKGMKLDTKVGTRDFFGSIEIIDEEKFVEAVYDYVQEEIEEAQTLDEIKKIVDKTRYLLLNNKDKNPLLSQISQQLLNLDIIAKSDIEAPRFIFDRKNELAKSTLGEAITKSPRVYAGHWIDKGYLNSAGFYELLSTWMHEICHKSGGDGTAEFTYKLTDMIESLLEIFSNSSQYQIDLLALEKVFNEIK